MRKPFIRLWIMVMFSVPSCVYLLGYGCDYCEIILAGVFMRFYAVMMAKLYRAGCCPNSLCVVNNVSVSYPRSC